jgi:hypothetical protein
MQTDLFTNNAQWEYDEEIKAFIPLPVREFPPTHYRSVQQHG